jgi:hypothetical protein
VDPAINLTFEVSMPPEIIGIMAICATVAIVAISRIFSQRLELKRDRRSERDDNDLVDRLHRIEVAVEATALEVERISEANRFMAKLLAERGGIGAPAVKPPERVVTPH